ncbi:MAG: hypothetical protein KKB00_07150 [Gammaproteobacteria bacterium]|nr:hypothetical protein [Gammaproteobacteria bacterium]
MKIIGCKVVTIALSLSAVTVALPAIAEVKLTPSLSLSSYAYQINVADGGTDEGLAQAIIPTLDLSYTSSWLQSSINLEHMSIVHKDAQRDNNSYSNYRIGNNALFFRDQLSVQLGSNQSYRSTSNTVSNYLDEISSTGDMAKVVNHNAGLSYNNQAINWLNTSINLTASESRSDQVIEPLFDEQDPFNQDVNVQSLSGGIEVQSADRNRKFFYGFSANGTKTARKQNEDLYSRSGYGVIGVPFFWRVSMIGQGSFENNSRLENINSLFGGYQNYHSVGGGLEWKITDRSWWNITFNKINDQEGRSEYIGTKFNIQPSRRTKLSGSLDRRFFGRTAEVSGSYNLKYLTMQLSVSDTVNSLLGLNEDDLQTGLFICPPGVVPGLVNCYQPPTAQYRPQPGESYYNIVLPGQELSEQVVVRRNANYTLGYAFSRLKLQFQIGLRRDIYLQREAEVNNQYINLTGNWQLSQRNSLTLSSSYSKIDSMLDESAINSSQREGTQATNTVTFDRKINHDLSGTVSVRRVDINFGGVALDYKENRVEFDLKFTF